MAGQQSLFDFPGARLELVQPLSLVRSFSSEEALDLEFTEKTLHNPFIQFYENGVPNMMQNGGNYAKVK
jgi:hypothetical protein